MYIYRRLEIKPQYNESQNSQNSFLCSFYPVGINSL